VIRRERPDIIALQEVDQGISRSNYDHQPRMIARALTMYHYFCVNRRIGHGNFGITTFSRFPIIKTKRFDLSYGLKREPRGLSRTDLVMNNTHVVQVFNVHLGLNMRERQFQLRKMLSESMLMDESLGCPKIILGDFNDSILSVVHNRLGRHFQNVIKSKPKKYSPTFKVGPIGLRLDHIYVNHHIKALGFHVVNNPLARVASDHLPLVANLEIISSE
jgi:endonuclease/exonuclease/phosphatase family metal-dependent hydrolase